MGAVSDEATACDHSGSSGLGVDRRYGVGGVADEIAFDEGDNLKFVALKYLRRSLGGATSPAGNMWNSP